ncbi:WhiB family transcriptional regulator [Streptomyces albidoflavus]|uniref:WhiB family transcriptional regulator n=1 Tax=Streptomyces albidoflavus TaxID=1886 RepID=UPI0033EC989B
MNCPPCTRDPLIFASEKGPQDETVLRAKAICSTCSDLAACRDRGREGAEYGVWGGESQTERFLALGVSATIPACSTGAAVTRHQKLGQDCQECREWDRERERQYDRARREKIRIERARRKAAREAESESRLSPAHAPLRESCGTQAGYQRHARRGELKLVPHPECECRQAHAEHALKQRIAKKTLEKAA